MVRTKQTPRGSTSHSPGGMMTATFTGTGRGKGVPEEQFRDAPEEDTEEDFPLVLEDAEQQPKKKPGSKNTARKLRSKQSQQRRTTSNQSYKSVKPRSFTTVPTSRTSCRRSQVKSRNHGKTHIFQH